MRTLRFALILSLCVTSPAATLAAQVIMPVSSVNVTVVTDEADAVLTILALRRSSTPVAEARWSSLFATAGYQNLKARETGMKRPFSDSAFRAFVLSDTLLARFEALQAAMASYRAIDIASAAAHARAYLPDGSSIHARLYIEIKPKTNSFVFALPEGRAIFLYLDPSVSKARAEQDIVIHELHHIGFAESCPTSTSVPVARQTAREYSSALGEGLAMLAAAGSAGVDPHASSPPDVQQRWEHDLADWRRDFPRVQQFLLDIAERRLTNTDSIASVAAPFWGDAQGAWYTVGYMMAATIERARGRDALRRIICDRSALMTEYNQLARMSGLPIWNERLIALLRPD